MGKNKKYQFDDFNDYEYDEEETIDRRVPKRERRPLRNWKKGWEQGKIKLEEDDLDDVHMNETTESRS